MSDDAADKRDPKAPVSPRTAAILALVQGLLPAMVAIAGGLWVAFTYLENQKETQKQQTAQAQRENRTRLIEARKQFIDMQLARYQETAEVVGKLVSWTKASDGDWEKNYRRYEQLFWTELSMVEDEGVKEAMIYFAEKLRSINPRRESATTAEFGDLKQRSYALARALKSGIEQSWDINLSGNVQRQ